MKIVAPVQLNDCKRHVVTVVKIFMCNLNSQIKEASLEITVILQKQCRSRNKQLNCTSTSGVAALIAENGAAHKVNVQIIVYGVQANALIDTESTSGHINRTNCLLHCDIILRSVMNAMRLD